MMGVLDLNGPMQIQRGVKWAFAIMTTLYLLTGAAAIVVPVYFSRTATESRRVVIVTDNVLRSLYAVGAYIIISALSGIVGALAPLRRKRFLQFYTWTIVLLILAEVSVGLWVWYRTLDANDMYAYNWRMLWPDSVKQVFQDNGSCCGPVLASKSCEQLSYGCMRVVQAYAQGYLSYVYTCLFSFVIVDVGAMLAGMVVLVMRNDEERWRWSRSKFVFSQQARTGHSSPSEAPTYIGAMDDSDNYFKQ
ncbi:hypothetical protein FBU59_000355 [Linderina macrospora]|uniref:Uncharacterized protein n=1 Tax=Linderina macrospora TaxID=4868 RepID=A0ACC1JH19_9FUNG|nr:hypothetical protein FBU59_000355 [Linderina macrospora]